MSSGFRTSPVLEMYPGRASLAFKVRWSVGEIFLQRAFMELKAA